MDDSTNAERHEPDVELYAVEEIADQRGEGLRIYRSDDAVYEAFSLDRAEARLYRDDGRWYAKVRMPETDIEDAYNRLVPATERINEAYGTALDIGPEAFRQRVDLGGAVSLEEEDTAVHYRDETELEDVVDAVAGDPATSSLLKGALAGVAADAGMGTVFGAALGALAGPPGVVGGAALGGSVWAGWGLVFDGLEVARIRRNRHRMNRSSRPLMKRAAQFFEERRKAGYQAVDAVKEHLSEVNRLHSLEEELEATREMDLTQHEERDKLEESGVEDAHDLLMQLHFHRVEEGAGVVAVHETDTYEAAADFITTVTGNTVPRQRPSLYTSPEAFRTVFDHLTYTEHDERSYLDDAAVLARNAHDRGTGEVTAWLEDKHRGLIRDATQYPPRNV